MKIAFEDDSYIEVVRSDENKIFLTIAAKSFDNPKKFIVNTVELKEEQLLALVKSIM